MSWWIIFLRKHKHILNFYNYYYAHISHSLIISRVFVWQSFPIHPSINNARCKHMHLIFVTLLNSRRAQMLNERGQNETLCGCECAFHRIVLILHNMISWIGHDLSGFSACQFSLAIWVHSVIMHIRRRFLFICLLFASVQRTTTKCDWNMARPWMKRLGTGNGNGNGTFESICCILCWRHSNGFAGVINVIQSIMYIVIVPLSAYRSLHCSCHYWLRFDWEQVGKPKNELHNVYPRTARTTHLHTTSAYAQLFPFVSVDHQPHSTARRSTQCPSAISPDLLLLPSPFRIHNTENTFKFYQLCELFVRVPFLTS